MLNKDDLNKIDKKTSENSDWYKVISGFALTHRLDFEVILKILESETEKALQRDINPDAEVVFIADHKKEVVLTIIKNGIVVEDEEIEFDENSDEPNPQRLIDIPLSQARIKNPEIQVDDLAEIEFDFSWLTQKHKSAIFNGFKSELKRIEKEKVKTIFESKIGQKFFGKVKNVLQRGSFSVEIYENEREYLAHLHSSKVNKSIDVHPGSSIEVILESVNLESSLHLLEVSMIEPEQVENALKSEIQEISDGDIEIVKIQRIPGIRTKVAVRPNPNKSFNFDIIGSIFGENARRIIAVSEKIGEKIDIIRYSDDKKEYIKNALSPAKVVDVAIHKTTQKAFVIVSKENKTIAIGKKGINIELASKLTGNKIDIIDIEKAIESKIPFKEPTIKKNTFSSIEKPLFNHSKQNRSKKSKSSEYFKDFSISMEEFDRDVMEFFNSVNSLDNQIKENVVETKKEEKSKNQNVTSNFDELFNQVEDELTSTNVNNDPYDFVNDLNDSFDINFADETEFEEYVEDDSNKKTKSTKTEVNKKDKVISEYKKIKDFKVDSDLANYGLDSNLDLSDLEDEWDN
ncbi:NusA N-terminal domain-containing protein [Mycoplasmopsis felis]|uniref:NusA N-terminal domain-containing protein n=1 Tax=Mycoplasmopsis felis TaxID=33923 RepID=UPI002AFFA82B|nr:NusA N-terminal domain-containing protein [Mycoplasmopsis felis]WQQ04301.1 KH domain-containing protein [Mycoplasmopsis felis]WQQ08300.1 KH domain-containing protein [Mycoplasmopsis felis]WRX06431.1 KH domain-containing protein [Mycoplasmopsis felis]